MRCLLGVLPLLLGFAAAQPLPAEVFERDKQYGDHPRQVIDVAARPLSVMKPAILFVHGGDWQAGDKRPATSKSAYFLSEGFAMASMNYRLFPEVSPREQAQDVAEAAVWLARNAGRYGIDPEQIFLTGHGAGAHLVALVGTDPSYLKPFGAKPGDLGGVITLDSGAYDIPAQMERTTQEAQYGRTLRQIFTQDADLWPSLSPAYKVDQSDGLPPFFVVYTQERADALRQARPFANALRKSGGIAMSFEAPGLTHNSLFRRFGTVNDETTEETLNFIRREANIPIQPLTQLAERKTPAINWYFSFDAPETDEMQRRLSGTEVTGIVTHNDQLYAAVSSWNESEAPQRGQILKLTGVEEHWNLELQMPRRYTRASTLLPVSFTTNVDGLPIDEVTYLFVGAAYEKPADEPGAAGLFIRPPSGAWAKQTIGQSDDGEPMTSVRAIAPWRDPETGVDHVFIGAAPSPLGIYRGAVDPAFPGGIGFMPTPEFVPLPGQGITGFADCGGHLYASTNQQILERQDGAEPRWAVVLDLAEDSDILPYAAELNPLWQEREEIKALRCDRARGGTNLLFHVYNRAWRFVPGAGGPLPEANIAQLVRSMTGRTAHLVMAQDATLMRFLDGDTEEWIGLEILYDEEYLETFPEFPYWASGFGKDAFYLVRTVIGGVTQFRLEYLSVVGNDPYQRPLARVRDFEKSPFERDNAVYAAGFAPWFEQVEGSGWITRGER
ncbi:MAG: alpha/beta hydrolase [Pseudomonadota bacterium]